MNSVKQNIAGLNGLRGLAAYIVAISHFAGATKTGDGFLQAGKMGVMIFFALSGFLMAHLYLTDKPTSIREIVNYVIRRFTRVYPLFLLFVLLSVMAVEFGSNRLSKVMFQIDQSILIDHILLQKGVSVLWTIPVEFKFYFAFVFIMASWSKFKEFSLLLILAVLFYNAMAGYPGAVNPTGAQFWSGYSSYFLIGILSALFSKKFNSETVNMATLNLGFVMCLALLPLLVPRAYGLIFPTDEGWVRNEVYIFYSGLIVFFCAHASFAKTVFGNRLIAFLGLISFSVYLVHVPVLRFIRIYTDIDQNVALYALAYFFVVTVVSALLYFLFEKPTMTWLNTKLIRSRDPVKHAVVS
ncbi:MAG: acyltransferase [Pseudomonadota bacterium]